jgi:hypothetical protein
VAVSCEHGNESSGSIKCSEILNSCTTDGFSRSHPHGVYGGTVVFLATDKRSVFHGTEPQMFLIIRYGLYLI